MPVKTFIYAGTHLLLSKFPEFITPTPGCFCFLCQCCCHGTRLFSCTDPSLPAVSHHRNKLEQRSISARTPIVVLCFLSFRFPWFLQLLHRWGVSCGPRAAGDSAELCFCFWHGGKEANEEVVGYTDDELQQPTRGRDPLLWPAHLYEASRPRQWAVLRPRTLQCHGQLRALSLAVFFSFLFSLIYFFEVMNILSCLWLLSDGSTFLWQHIYMWADWELVLQ